MCDVPMCNCKEVMNEMRGNVLNLFKEVVKLMQTMEHHSKCCNAMSDHPESIIDLKDSDSQDLPVSMQEDALQFGMGQAGIIPSSFLADLDIETSALNAAEQMINEELHQQSGIQSKTLVIGAAPRDHFQIGETESDIKKRKNKILASVPGVHTANPIAAVTNFCRHHLKFDVDFDIDEQPSGNPSEPLYVVKVLFPEGECIGEYSHTRKKYAKEMAAKCALHKINEDEQLLGHYIGISLTRPP